MGVVKVAPSVHNAADNAGLIAQLVKMVNLQAAAINVMTAMLDADIVGAADYVATVGTMDTVAYKGGGTPA